MKKIFLVDDHPMLREGLQRLIEQQPGCEVCGESDTASGALEAILRLSPDLVMTDISLPDKNGLELIKDLQALSPTIPILVFSMHDEMLYAERAMRAGAKGYLMKGTMIDGLWLRRATGEALSPQDSTALVLGVATALLTTEERAQLRA